MRNKRWLDSPNDKVSNARQSGRNFGKFMYGGGPSPGIKFSILIVLLSFVGWFVYACSTLPDEGSKSAVPAKPLDLNDAEALDKEFDVYAISECASNADDFLRETAKWDFKWDEVGLLDTKFDSYRRQVENAGILTLVSHKVALSNGFGAFQHQTLLCDFDTQTKKVVGYRFQ